MFSNTEVNKEILSNTEVNKEILCNTEVNKEILCNTEVFKSVGPKAEEMCYTSQEFHSGTL